MRKPMKHNEPNGSAGELMLELARTPWGESPLNTKNPLAGNSNGGIEGDTRHFQNKYLYLM